MAMGYDIFVLEIEICICLSRPLRMACGCGLWSLSLFIRPKAAKCKCIHSHGRDIYAYRLALIFSFFSDKYGLTGWLRWTAVLHLDKARIWNREIKVSPSKHFVVQMPKDGQPVS